MSRSVAPQTKITAHPTALICQDTDLRGEITIGSGTVIHPKAAILALDGPIVIGNECIIEEIAMIVNQGKEVMRIGAGNHFMIGCRIESPMIGDFNTFQPRSKASARVTITDHCTLSANTLLLPNDSSSPPNDSSSPPDTLSPYTVIFGEDSDRRNWGGNSEVTERTIQAKHIEYLREVIPKYNKMRAI